MFSLIGLGLDEKGYSREAYELISKSDKIYLEDYTVDFPYELKELEKQFKKKKFIKADREFVESFDILEESKKQNVALLVYGNPLMATTHISLIEESKKRKIKYKVIHNVSILDAVSETGLQIYKFGKIVSIPKHDASSFLEIIKDNKKIHAHSLILADIGLGLNEVFKKLKDITGKILICSQLGTANSKIFYGKISKLKKIKIKKPFCIVVPGKLHFVEEEFLENFKDE